MIRRPSIPILLLVVLALGACGASAREKTLRASLIAVNAASEGFAAWNLEHQRSIRSRFQPTEREKYDVAIAEYFVQREPVIEARTVAYRAIGVATLLEEDQRSLDAVLEAVRKLQSAIVDLKGSVSP